MLRNLLDRIATSLGYFTQLDVDAARLENANQTTTVNFQMVAGSENGEDVIPITATELLGNYPNPFNPETTLSFALKTAGRVKLTVYNLKGQVVKDILNSDLPTGYHKYIWNGRDQHGKACASGIYYYRMESADYQCVKKMILMQ